MKKEHKRKKARIKKKKYTKKETKEKKRKNKEKRNIMSLDQFMMRQPSRQSGKDESSMSNSVLTGADKLELNSDPNSFMESEYDSTNFVDIVDLSSLDIDGVLDSNRRLLEFVKLEGTKLFVSMFDNRQRLRKAGKKRKSSSTREGDSDSDSDGGNNEGTAGPWRKKQALKAGGASGTDLKQLTAAERSQFYNFPHMPLHSYSLGDGLFMSNIGYKLYPNSPQMLKIGRMSFQDQPPENSNPNLQNLFQGLTNNNSNSAALDALFQRKRKKGISDLSKISAYCSNVPLTSIPMMVICLLHMYRAHLETCKELQLPEDIRTGIDKPAEANLPPIQPIK